MRFDVHSRLLRRVPPKYVRIGGYLAFFLFCFFMFVYWTFPYERLRDYIVQEVEYPRGPDGTRRPSGWQLEIVELSPDWLTGVELEGVRLVKLPTEPGDKLVDVTMEQLQARTSIFALLTGTTDIGFDAEVGGGTIEGEYAESEEAVSVQATLDAVNLRRLGVLRSLIGLPLGGIAKGEMDVTLAQKAEETNGNFQLDIEDTMLGDGNARLKIEGMQDGITIERINAGELNAHFAIERGVARVEQLRARGPDIELEGSGNIRLQRPMKLSRVDMTLRFKVTDAYRNRNDRTRAIFSLMDFAPQLKAARTPDGSLQYRLSGSFAGRIRTTPAGRR